MYFIRLAIGKGYERIIHALLLSYIVKENLLQLMWSGTLIDKQEFI